MRNVEIPVYLGTLKERLARARFFQEPLERHGTDLAFFHKTNGDGPLEELRARETAARKTSILDKEDITSILALADQKGVASHLLAKAKEAIDRRTTALRDTNEISRFGFTETEGGKLVMDTIKEEWGVPIIIGGRPATGTYRHAKEPSERLIRIAYPRPTVQETLISLAMEGRLTQAEQTADHERLHAIQFNLGGTHIPPELLEAQAYRIEPLSYTEVSHDSLVNHLISSEDYPATLDARKFEYAVWSIDRLDALGYSPEEVVEIISEAGPWDNEQGVWHRIDDRIRDRMNDRGLNEETLEGLLIISNLDKQVAREEARAITQKVLGEAYLDDFVEISKEKAPKKRRARHRKPSAPIF